MENIGMLMIGVFFGIIGMLLFKKVTTKEEKPIVSGGASAPSPTNKDPKKTQ